MLKVAVLNDYQNVFQTFLNLKKLDGKYEFKIFNEAFTDENDTGEQLKDYEALLIMRERTKITKSLINRLKKLKFIITSGMRNKAIDLEAAKQNKIIVCGTGINSNPTAELTWALILGLVRNFKEEIDNMYQGYWQTTVGFELKGKILGLIGLGKIGSQVAKVGTAFGMQVAAWSENLNLSHAKELGVLPMNKEDLIKMSDFISIHVVLGERYNNLITKNDFQMMKKSTFLINTSRGPIVNEGDLVEALKSNQIAGAGLDVYDHEPLPDNHKLRFLPNALLLPHLGYVTAENYSIFYTQMLEDLEACVKGKPIRVIDS
jgi:D-3-phosphoglycerate dehydrogenase